MGIARAQDSLKYLDPTSRKMPWNRTYPFELFAGYNLPQQAFDATLKVHLINKKSQNYCARIAQGMGAPMKMCLILGQETCVNRSIIGLKGGVDFTPFFFTKYRHVSWAGFGFSDFLFYTVGQSYVRLNYVYYSDLDRGSAQVLRPEIAFSPSLECKRTVDCKDSCDTRKRRSHHFYLHPTIAYGYDVGLRSNSTTSVSPHHLTVGISISYEKRWPYNTQLGRRIRRSMQGR